MLLVGENFPGISSSQEGEKSFLSLSEKGNTKFFPDQVITIGHNYRTQNNKVMIEFPLAWHKTLELTEVIKKKEKFNSN